MHHFTCYLYEAVKSQVENPLFAVLGVIFIYPACLQDKTKCGGTFFYNPGV